jgi:hypothetical protein
MRRFATRRTRTEVGSQALFIVLKDLKRKRASLRSPYRQCSILIQRSLQGGQFPALGPLSSETFEYNGLAQVLIIALLGLQVSGAIHLHVIESTILHGRSCYAIPLTTMSLLFMQRQPSRCLLLLYPFHYHRLLSIQFPFLSSWSQFQH